jgi:serine/threonine-protein kinase
MPDQLDRLKNALADRYALEREIGSGGMATVYLAEDLKHHRQVAIKVLRPDLAATLGPERFLREIEVAAQLQHPHILPLHDSGEADGFLYYVMPYVEGQSLRDKLAKEGELPIGDAVRILRDVVDALTEAHAHGVVHRDIKPENILLRGRHALVTDFGVAKAVSEATGREQLTTAGVALGTPAYMAPEQASADPHLDHRVDIYAVGAVAYELLTGRPVFMGTTPQMVLAAHVTEAPQPVTKHRDTVPPALEQLVLRCLEKKPADRWQTAEELLPQLESLTTPSGGMTPTGTMPVQAIHVPRRKQLIRAAGIVGLAVLVVVGWRLLLGRGERTAVGTGGTIVVAVLTFDSRTTGEDAESFSEGMADDITTQLSKIGGFGVKAPASARRLSADTMSYSDIAALLDVDYLVHGSWDRAGTDLRITAQLIAPATEEQMWVEEYNGTWTAADIFDIRSDVARQVAAALDLKLTPEEQEQIASRPTRNTDAYEAYQLGRLFWNKRSDEGIRRAIEYFTTAIAADSGFAFAYVGLADAHVVSPWYTFAEPTEAHRQAESAALQALAIDSSLGEAYAPLALIQQNDWDLDGAETAFERALALSPNYATAHQWYGTYLVWLGRIDEGLAEIRQALDLDPLSLIINLNLVEALRAANRFDDAVEQYHKLRVLSPTFLGEWDLAWAHIGNGNLEEALAVFDRTNDDLGRLHVYARLGEWDAARRLYADMQEPARASSTQGWRSGLSLATAAWVMGDTNRTYELLERAVEERDPGLVDVSFRIQPRVGLWNHPRFWELVNSMGLDLAGGRFVQLEAKSRR